MRMNVSHMLSTLAVLIEEDSMGFEDDGEMIAACLVVEKKLRRAIRDGDLDLSDTIVEFV